MYSARFQPTRRNDAALIVGPTFLGFAIICAIGTLGPNFGLSILAASTFVSGVMLLWRPNESPILLVIFLFQWLQGSGAIFQASFQNVPIDSLYNFSAPFDEAIVLTHMTLFSLAVGMRLSIGHRNASKGMQISRALRGPKMSYWFKLYVIFWVLGAAATYGQRAIPGLSQVFLGVIDLRWAFYFMLAAAFFAQRRTNGIWFMMAFGFELALGIGGYFSDFKTVFIVTFLALFAAGARIGPKWMIIAGTIVGAAIYLGIIWTAVKSDYRAYVSGGQGQVVNVGYMERTQKLLQLSQSVDDEKFSEAIEQFADRVSYIKFFAASLDHVPTVIPHEGGALTIDAISRPFMPRMLFPNKPIIDDSIRTARYTGLEISGRERNTSISLGWVAEVYVDFGRWFMLLAGVGLGMFYGLIQRVLTNWSATTPLFGMACSSAILVNALFLETSITKVTGGLIASLIATWGMVKFVVPHVAPQLVRRR